MFRRGERTAELLAGTCSSTFKQLRTPQRQPQVLKLPVGDPRTSFGFNLVSHQRHFIVRLKIPLPAFSTGGRGEKDQDSVSYPLSFKLVHCKSRREHRFDSSLQTFSCFAPRFRLQTFSCFAPRFRPGRISEGRSTLHFLCCSTSCHKVAYYLKTDNPAMQGIAGSAGP